MPNSLFSGMLVDPICWNAAQMPLMALPLSSNRWLLRSFITSFYCYTPFLAPLILAISLNVLLTGACSKLVSSTWTCIQHTQDKLSHMSISIGIPYNNKDKSCYMWLKYFFKGMWNNGMEQTTFMAIFKAQLRTEETKEKRQRKWKYWGGEREESFEGG